MMSRAWAVLVAGGLVLSTSGGRGQDAGPAPAPMTGEPGAGPMPAPMEHGPADWPCPSDTPTRPVRDLVASHPVRDWVASCCAKRADAACDLCPKGHDLKGWLTYHSQARGFCAPTPCCAPPLYTFFLNPCCDSAAPCCQEPKPHCVDGHRLKELIFWRHAGKEAANGPGGCPAGPVAAAAPVPTPHP